MGLITAIKSALGLGEAGSTDGTDVTVEREADATTERAVKTDVSDSGTDASSATAAPEDAAESGSSSAADASASDDQSGGEAAGESLDSIKGIGPAYAERLESAGVRTVDELADADPAELSERVDVGRGRLETWIERARSR